MPGTVLGAKDTVISRRGQGSVLAVRGLAGMTDIKSITTNGIFDHVVEPENQVSSPDFATRSTGNLEHITLLFPSLVGLEGWTRLVLCKVCSVSHRC